MSAGRRYWAAKNAARLYPPGSAARHQAEWRACQAAAQQARQVSRISGSWALPMWLQRALGQ